MRRLEERKIIRRSKTAVLTINQWLLNNLVKNLTVELLTMKIKKLIFCKNRNSQLGPEVKNTWTVSFLSTAAILCRGSGSGSFHHQANKFRKILMNFFMALFLSLETDANVPSKGNMQKNKTKNLFFVGIFWKPPTKRAGSRAEGTDPQIRILTKMSRLHNTTEKNIILGCYLVLSSFLVSSSTGAPALSPVPTWRFTT